MSGTGPDGGEEEGPLRKWAKIESVEVRGGGSVPKINVEGRGCRVGDGNATIWIPFFFFFFFLVLFLLTCHKTRG